MGNMNTLIAIAIGIFTLAIIAAIVPSVGEDIESNTGAPNGSAWDASNITTSGADVWGDNVSTISTAAGILVVGVIIGVVMGLQRKRG